MLSKTNNKNLATGFNRNFEITDSNAMLYVFASGAQKGEGNIIINGKTYSDVWSGTDKSFDTFTTSVDSNNVNVYFESVGSTILGLHQMLVVDQGESLIINAPDVEKYFKGPERFVATVMDSNRTPISGKAVNITINGVTYTKTTDKDGVVSIALGIVSGKYNVTTAADNTKVISLVTILPTVNGTDVIKVFKNGTQYYATFKDSAGNYLASGTNVQFNINGVLYNRNIEGDKGLAKLNINLPQGEYIITAINPKTTELASNNIIVISKIVENKDLVKYYKNNSQYYVKILGDDGKPVGAGKIVTFNINGVMYERQTDESGFAKLTINLQPGQYVITAMYGGCSVANDIVVLPVLTASDLTMRYRDGSKFKANLVDGQGKPLTGATIEFNINGVFYQRTTDNTGLAALNINLIPGEYIITSSYNGANIANKITIIG